MIAKFICATVVALSAIAVDQRASAEQVIIEAQAHHLGNDPGNEGTVFEKAFVLDSVPPDAFLQLDITGPNLESPPQIFINGTSVGSIQPFFPPYNPNDPRWQLNPDGSHDFTGLIQAWFPVTSLLNVGSNIFRIQNGRPDDDYFFSNVILTYCQAHPVAPPIEGSSWRQADPNWGGVPYNDVDPVTCPDEYKIKDQGCGLIALNFALNAAGQNLTPLTLNLLLNNLPGDYTPRTPKRCSGGQINWSSAVKDASGGTLAFFDKSQTGPGTLNALDLYLCRPNRTL